MIALAEQTILGWAEEATWGEAATSGFTSIPLITENLAGSRRHIRHQHLQPAYRGQNLINTDESAGGEVELMPDISMLQELMSAVLMATVPSYEMGNIFAPQVSNNRITLSPECADAWRVGDMFWLADSQTKQGQWVTYRPDARGSRSGQLIASDDTVIPSRTNLTLQLRRFDPAQRRRSWTMLKQYGGGSDWMQLAGMMIRRLELATTADQMLRADASFIGKSMNVISGHVISGSTRSDDTPNIDVSDQPQPLFLGQSDIRLILRQEDGDSVDLTAQTNISVTGFRLVLEQSGLSPRYGLGSRFPDAMLGGRLMAYGTIDLMGSHQDIITWFSDAKPLQLICQISLDDIGFGFRIPQMIMTELTNTTLISGEPVHHHLRFDASANLQSNLGSLIHLYTS